MEPAAPGWNILGLCKTPRGHKTSLVFFIPLLLALKEISSQQIQQANAPKVFVNIIVLMFTYTFL